MPPRAAICALLLALHVALGAQASRTTPKFYADDPLLVDDDARFDASKAEAVELSEGFDFLQNTFGSPGDRSRRRAVNVNSLDEVPDSTWFSNRIGARDMTAAEIVRGPGKFDRLDAQEWTIVSGKGPGGFHPGFRASHPGDPKQVYQLEVDPPDYPQLATGAELIGTLIYHALGYHVVDIYLVRVHPDRIRIAPDATIRDASGTRKYTRGDLDTVLRVAARDAEGRVYFSATRFEEGKPLGNFEYHGTRADDPNDIYSHEHRRELRANRVFAAWLAHDDSRAVNTLNMLVEENGRRFVRHYMYDFGAILGSATQFPDTVQSGHEYYIQKDASVRALSTLGLYVPRYARTNYPDIPPSAGFISSLVFEPEKWKPNYPNAAFSNMRPDDAFWGARLVGRFSDEIIGTIVGAAGYDDAEAAAYLKRTLIERRDKITRTWLTGVNPIVSPALAADGTLTFANAAVDAGAAPAPEAYLVTWSRFDNVAGTHHPLGGEQTAREPRLAPTGAIPAGAEYISAAIRTIHPQYPHWKEPVQVYFRRTSGGWKAVGLFRAVK